MSIQSLRVRDSNQCIESRVVLPLDPKLPVYRDKPHEAGENLSNKHESRTSPNISVIPSRSFPQSLN